MPAPNPVEHICRRVCLPEATWDFIEQQAKKLGTNKSAFVQMVLLEKQKNMAENGQETPPEKRK